MRSSSSMNITALDSSLLSRFNESSTIEELLSQLMADNWNLSIIYKNYYEGCQPTKCSYTYVTRNDAVYVATSTGCSKIIAPPVLFSINLDFFFRNKSKRGTYSTIRYISTHDTQIHTPTSMNSLLRTFKTSICVSCVLMYLMVE